MSEETSEHNAMQSPVADYGIGMIKMKKLGGGDVYADPKTVTVIEWHGRRRIATGDTVAAHTTVTSDRAVLLVLHTPQQIRDVLWQMKQASPADETKGT